MANKKLQRIFCLTVGLLTLLLGACATSQNNDKTSSKAVARSTGSYDALSAKRRRERRSTPDTAGETYDDVWDRIRDGFGMPELDSPHVDYYVEWYAKRPDYMNRMVDRASLYLYHIVEELERNDFPMEIALLPAIESAYKPTAYSHAHASGLWQFISATGSRYGLKQNWWYDGRRDVLGATEAAIQYLSFLRDEFNGDWFHALAAYNTGERRVERAILSNRRHGKPTGYQHLTLRDETVRYVPKLIAIKRIIADPERYGITLEPIPNRPYFEVVETGSQIDLGVVAEAAGISTSELQDLNPGFRRWATDPTGPHRVLVPAEARAKVVARLEGLPQDKRMRWASHDVRRGDTLGQIAGRYGVTVSALQSSNQLKGTLIRPGQTLLVPLSTQSLASTGSIPVSGTADRGTALQASRSGQWGRYTVRGGDTLSRIARQHGISVSTLRSSNNLRGSMIRVGQTLRVPSAITTSSGQQPIVHQVRRGDTLWRIAQRYQVDVKQLQHWNEIASQDILKLGQKIMVYLN